MYTHKAGRKPALQQNWQSSEKSNILKGCVQVHTTSMHWLFCKLSCFYRAAGYFSRECCAKHTKRMISPLIIKMLYQSLIETCNIFSSFETKFKTKSLGILSFGGGGKQNECFVEIMFDWVSWQPQLIRSDNKSDQKKERLHSKKKKMKQQWRIWQ